jgi:hypothetical protein
MIEPKEALEAICRKTKETKIAYHDVRTLREKMKLKNLFN